MLDGQDVVKPVLQILAIKNIQNNMDGMTRYKVTLHDGESQHNCNQCIFFLKFALLYLYWIKKILVGILATQKNSLVEDGSMKIGSVIRLDEFASNILSKEPPKSIFFYNIKFFQKWWPN